VFGNWNRLFTDCCNYFLFLGAVTTVQTAYQLVTPLVSRATIAQIVRDSVILELSPTVVSIVLAGVVGSKIASELGNMRITEQIDALEIMGINTRSYLVMPKCWGHCLWCLALLLSLLCWQYGVVALQVLSPESSGMIFMIRVCAKASTLTTLPSLCIKLIRLRLSSAASLHIMDIM
jgi:ABC-type transporter Mla maintaining outer membrane lipid asymmetry permease subunit MlaE